MQRQVVSVGNFKIISDSSCDLPEAIVKEYGIDIIPYYVTLDSSVYYKENIDITNEEFYRRLTEEKAMPKTSLPSISDYLEVFKKYAGRGLDILCICLTSKFSGSYQSAVNAANMLKEDYPDIKAIVVDSFNATGGQGLIVSEAFYMKKAGLSIEEVADKINKLKLDAKIIFTVNSLEYLRRGGRLGLVSSLAGDLLNIKPIIYLKDAELKPHSKIRGRKKAIKNVIEILVEEIAANPEDYRFAFITADCHDEAKRLADVLFERHGIMSQLPLMNVGVTIGAHTGPSAIGVAFIKKYTI